MHVSFELNNKAPVRGWEGISKSGKRLSTALAVLGANGSGKTALLKPLAFAAWFMRNSFNIAPEELIPITAHFGSPTAPTVIELEAEDNDGIAWRYILHVTEEKVLHEALYRKNERFSYVFIRTWNETTQSYDIKQQGFGLENTQAKKTRKNASLISTALQYDIPIAQHITNFNFSSNVNYIGRNSFQSSQIRPATELFSNDENLKEIMTGYLVKWDLGLSDIKIREVLIPNEESNASRKILMTYGVHTTADKKTIELPLDLESSGTQSAFVLLSRILPVLKQGGIAVIDEIENDLHPHMVEPILDLFSNPKSNPYHAQLIFTCHSPEVLDFLQKSQVVFVEKKQCESIAFRGDEIQGLRSDDNLRSKYMAGALGAVPEF